MGSTGGGVLWSTLVSVWPVWFWHVSFDSSTQGRREDGAPTLVNHICSAYECQCFSQDCHNIASHACSEKKIKNNFETCGAVNIPFLHALSSRRGIAGVAPRGGRGGKRDKGRRRGTRPSFLRKRNTDRINHTEKSTPTYDLYTRTLHKT